MPKYALNLCSVLIWSTFLRPRLAKWALPDEVVLLDSVPKTSVGKFDKKVLRQRFKDWTPPA